jgi:hypothetical protein
MAERNQVFSKNWVSIMAERNQVFSEQKNRISQLETMFKKYYFRTKKIGFLNINDFSARNDV